ncbi:MAG: tetratricopeptide repeat protein [Pseudomonadota bacterium]
MEITRVQFGAFELNQDRRELTRDGEVVELQSRVFDLLSYLVTHRDRVVSKDELMDAVWPGRVVGEAALARAIMKARKAVQDDANQQALIRTVHGHGYHFVAECREISPATAEKNATPLATADQPAATGTSPAAVDPTNARNTPWAMLAAAMLIAVAVLTLVIAPWRSDEVTADQNMLRMAVLPVIDRTGDPELAWSRLGLMSFVRAQLAEAPEFQTVRDGDVLALADQQGWDGPLVGEAAEQVFEQLIQVQGVSHALLLELVSDVAGFRMNWALHEVGRNPRQGTMVGADGTQLAAGAVQAVYGNLLGRSRLVAETPLISEDSFLNEAFSRGMALSLEGRCGETERYFNVIIEEEPHRFAPRFELASCLRILGRNDEAEPLLEALIEEQRSLAQDEHLAKALMTLGVLYNRTGRLDLADTTLSEALTFAESAGSWELAGRILQNQAILAEDQNNWAESEALLDRSVLAYQRAGREVLPGQIASHRANLAMDQGRLAEGDAYLDEAIAAFRLAGDRRNEAMMLNNRGYLRRQQGQLDEAQQFHEQSLAIRQAIGDRVGVGRIYGMLAGVHSASGDYAAARDAAESARSIAEETGDRLYNAIALASLGDAQRNLGEMVEARSSYEQSGDVFRSIDDRMRALMIDLRLARLALDDDDPATTERVALRVRDKAAETGLAQAELDAMELLGDAYLAAEKVDDASLTYAQTLERVRQTDWVAREARLLIKLARLHMDQADLESAAALVGALAAQESSLASLRIQARYAAETGDATTAVSLLERGQALGSPSWSSEDDATLAAYRDALP